MSTLSPTAHGIVIFIGAGAMFTLMDLMAKLLATRVDTVQTLWARYTVQMILVTILIAPRARTVLRTRYPWLQFWRSVFLMGATGFFFTAYLVLDLTEVIAIMQVSPVTVMLGAALFLGERFGAARAIAAAIGLIGALIIVRPGSEAFSLYSILPFFGVLCYSGYALATRFVGDAEDVWTSLFYAALLATILLTLAVPFNWQPLEASDLPLLIGVGAFGAIGQLLLIRALSIAEASILAPFSYTALIFAALVQFVVFGFWPDMWTVTGAIVIVAAGLYLWTRDSRGRAERGSVQTG